MYLQIGFMIIPPILLTTRRAGLINVCQVHANSRAWKMESNLLIPRNCSDENPLQIINGNIILPCIFINILTITCF